MPKKRPELDRIADTIEKILVLQLWARGVSQEKIAKSVGKQIAWVNALLKGIPKGGQSHGSQSESKKAEKGKKSRKNRQRTRRD
jgi:hypothetical protein